MLRTRVFSHAQVAIGDGPLARPVSGLLRRTCPSDWPRAPAAMYASLAWSDCRHGVQEWQIWAPTAKAVR